MTSISESGICNCLCLIGQQASQTFVRQGSKAMFTSDTITEYFIKWKSFVQIRKHKLLCCVRHFHSSGCSVSERSSEWSTYCSVAFVLMTLCKLSVFEATVDLGYISMLSTWANLGRLVLPDPIGSSLSINCLGLWMAWCLEWLGFSWRLNVAMPW